MQIRIKTPDKMSMIFLALFDLRTISRKAERKRYSTMVKILNLIYTLICHLNEYTKVEKIRSLKKQKRT